MPAGAHLEALGDLGCVRPERLPGHEHSPRGRPRGEAQQRAVRQELHAHGPELGPLLRRGCGGL